MEGKKKSAVGWMHPAARYFRGPGRWGLAIAGLLVLFGLGGWVAWQAVREELLFSDQYLLRKEHIYLSGPPGWIRSDVLQEVFDRFTRDKPWYVWEKQLCAQLAEAFARHPWVAKVQRVEKRYPALIYLEVQWRRPVCMVVWQQRYFPVDREGRLLPGGDFTPEDVKKYPHLLDISTPPPPAPGMRWQDGRLLQAAQLAEALAPVWEKFQLAFFRPVPSPGQPAAQPLFELWTHRGSRILWGFAPAGDRPGEPSMSEKIARLQSYIQQYGSLDAPRPGQTLDVRFLKLHPSSAQR